MSTLYLGTALPSMEKWVQVHVLLSIAALTLYPQLTEGLPLQQGPPPALDQCEFQGYGNYEEQCGSKVIQMPLCNPGQERVWQCDPETLPDDFAPDNLNICQSCPQGFYQKWYNKCGTCHRCTVCGEGETEVKACEMEEDTKCAKVSTGTESFPAIVTPPTGGTMNPTKNTAAPLNLHVSPTAILTYGVIPETGTPCQTNPLKDAPDMLSNANPHKDWWYVGAIILLALLFVVTLILLSRECLIRRRLQGDVRNHRDVERGIQLTRLNNGDVPHDIDANHNIDENREPEERDPLMGEGVEPVRIQMARDDAEGNDVLGDDAHGPPADDDEEQGADLVPGGAHDTRKLLSRPVDSSLDPATSCGASNDGTSCSSGTTDEEKDDILSPSDGLVVDIPDKTQAGATEHCHSSDDTDLSGNLPPESATGASGHDEADSKDDVSMDALTTSGGHGVSKPGETLVDGRNGATGAPPDDLGTPNATTTSASGGHVVNKPKQTLADVSCSTPAVSPDDLGTPNATTTSAGGDCWTGDANSDGVDTSGSNDGDMEGPGSVRAPPNAAPEEGATNAGIDSNGTTDTDGANHGAEASGGGQDEPVVESSDDVPASKRSGACGHSSDGADVDAREPNSAAPEQVKPQIQADDVVSHMFLQHVAQAVPYVQVKKICRMLRLQEKDIDDVEALEHKAERAYEFLKRLLGEIGKDLTYRSLLQALNSSQNKHYADILIREFDIRI